MMQQHEAAMYDVIIIGGGPAGLSAALYLGRARRSVLLCMAGSTRNDATTGMHGYLTREGYLPSTFLAETKKELLRYPNVQQVQLRIGDIARVDTRFAARAVTGERYESRRVLLATGVKDVLPKVDGLAERWGKNVFVCPFCDGWEMQDRRILINGDGRDTVELAQELAGWSDSLHLCAEHNDLTEDDHRWIAATGSTLSIGHVQRISGKDNTLETVELQSGEKIACDAMFLSAPLRQRCDLAESLGCTYTDEGAIAISPGFETSVQGCYAAGDAVTHFHQVVIAAASGASAAISMSNDLLAEEASAKIASIRT